MLVRPWLFSSEEDWRDMVIPYPEILRYLIVGAPGHSTSALTLRFVKDHLISWL
jgi:hypothetical protein